MASDTSPAELDDSDAVGARIHVRRRDGLTQMRELETGGSFLGTHPIEAHFGVGVDDVTAITVRWPDGTRWPGAFIEHFRPSGAAVLNLTRGSGFDLFIDAFV